MVRRKLATVDKHSGKHWWLRPPPDPTSHKRQLASKAVGLLLASVAEQALAAAKLAETEAQWREAQRLWD